jgi:hypothetical protein
MKRHLLLCALVLSFFTTLAQVTVVDTNNVAASVNTSGSLFRGSSGMAGFEFPKGSGIHTIFASSFWLGGITPDSQLKLAAGMYGNEQGDYYTGPLTADGSATITAETMAAYDQVFLANSADVETHLLFLESVANNTYNEVFPNGYTVPEWFFEWPAMGDYLEGQALFLAPFFDYDGDLVYNPSNGDYPLFPGDECAYIILNDKGGVHYESLGEPMGVEIHCFVYSFNDELDEALNNSVFVRYEIINRSAATYNDVYAGIFSDLDIGSSIDDYIASHVEQAAYYAYNGDSFDEPTFASGGYGETPPIQAVAVLSGPLKQADETDDLLPAELGDYETYGPFGTGYNDGIIDNERLGLTNFMYINTGTSPITGDPDNTPDFYNYMRGIWKNGQTLSFGGFGVNNGGMGEMIEADYAFPGTSDPLFIGTQGVETTEWTELIGGNTPGDRKGVGAMGPFILEPGDHQTIDIVYSSIENEAGADPNELVGQTIGGLRQAFLDNIFSEIPELGRTVGITEELSKQSLLSMYPNPAVDMVSFTHPVNTQIQIFAADGRLVAQWFAASKTSQFDVSQLESGVYMVVAKSDDIQVTERLFRY